MSSPNPSGRAELAGILGLAAQQDGPIRLFMPRNPKARKRHPGLFPSSRGKHGKLQKELLGTMLEEVLSRPRMVRLTEFGMETLLRNTPQAERPRLIATCSVLYRDALLSTWTRFATRGEQDILLKTVRSIHGHWFPQAESEGGSDLDDFRELLAQEVADSWSKAKGDEARNRLAHLLRLLGAEPFGKESDVVQFTGLQHTPVKPLFKGDQARIVRPGWAFPKSPTPLLLVKAEVSPHE